MNNNKSLESVMRKFFKMRDDRNWKQFHNPKNLAISLTLEATEVLEFFQWSNMEESQNISIKEKENLAEEIADVATYLFALADSVGVYVIEAMDRKMDKNIKKYPVEKSKNNSTKYNKLYSGE